MSEYCLTSPGDKPVGTVAEVAAALLAQFPGSEKEEARLVAVWIAGEHVADVYLYGPADEDEDDENEDFNDFDDLDNPDIARSPVTTFSVLGDDDGVIMEFLIKKYGVEDLPL